jgi:poly-gamma-glutamate capsule biosynthesis protein CapA/YwtB (metallophosphatase superfamily)
MKLALILVGLLVVGVLAGAVSQFTIFNLQFSNNDMRSELVSERAVVTTPTPAGCTFTVAAVGDVMLGRSVLEQMERRQDWTWPFDSTAAILAEAEITLGNLEAPLVTGCYQKENRYVLCSKPEAVAGLTAAGFDVLSLANNHTLNWGMTGYEETIRVLEQAGIDSVDQDKVSYWEQCGVKLGFVGLDDVSQPLNLELAAVQVASLAAEVEVPIVLIHWGIEYVDQPRPRQREVAAVLVEAGAKVIVGSHPHWVQPAERMGEAVVFWSLGNFVFDQMWSEETRRGEIALLRFITQDANLKTVEYEMMPVRIYDYGQPRIE